MSSVLPPTPTSPGVGIRRKGPKTLPRLPLSAFSPPNSGTSDRFPLPPSPSTVHPERVVDANVALTDDDVSVARWKKNAGEVFAGRVGGLVVILPNAGPNVKEVVSRLAADKAQTSVLSAVVPFRLDAAPDESVSAVLAGSTIPISLATTFDANTTSQHASTLKWALQQGRPVDIDIQVDLSDEVFETLEDLLSKATTDLTKVPPIILCAPIGFIYTFLARILTVCVANLLPPPHQLELPIVKLMNHPVYRRFQAQVAALSLIPQLYIKYLPPYWEAPPAIPSDETPTLEGSDSRQQKEWKRRIKMYLGPVMEAFGFQRIIFGSSPSKSSKSTINAGDWYELARESLAELGVEQESVDAVFSATAFGVYKS
ncbi:hypothetical protein V5O48_018185 [Marasmius crinis-equi]|uniref:Uncharacterized protein n=1 Tax=Marasmius crinis-equi TaxID=585013 RepID=A0ABR3EM15_9AGAR